MIVYKMHKVLYLSLTKLDIFGSLVDIMIDDIMELT